MKTLLRPTVPPHSSRWGRAFLALATFVITATGALAQNVTVNPGAGSYPTLKDAFDAINLGTHTGAVTVDVVGSTTETASAVLNASGSGSASYTSITISPTGGAARTISGAIVAGSPLIDLNGADNVTFDGLNTGGNSLTIANTTVSATSGTSTIRFIGGATGNTITNCNVQGSGTMSVATNGATIFFSTDGVTANGNDNNTISNCNIGPAGANLPTKAILGNGSTTTTAIGNSGIVINNNNIFDYFGAAVTSAGIATNGGCNGWSITNNRFYQTGTRTWTTGALHNAMNIGPSTATSGAQGFTITGNIVGYASNTQTGTYTLTGSTGTFRGIVFNGITLGTSSTVSNNTVASVSVTGVTSSGISSGAPFIGIYITNGVVTSNGNTIGSQSATGSLVYSTTSASAADAMGIFNFSVDAWTANSNNIGGITASNAGAGAANVYGLRLNTSGTVTTTLSSNNVGGTVANSLQSTSTATGAQVAGIFVSTSIATVSGNTIRNLTAAGGTGIGTAASVVGIAFISNTPVNTASQNTIFNLTNTNASAATVVTGIQFTGAAAGNVVARNLITGLSSATNSATAEVNGIRVSGGTTVYRNNMINLGVGIPNAIGAGASNSSTSGINGFNGFLGTDSFFNNSIYIGGSAAAGTGASYAFNGTQTLNTRSFRNNIFFNARTNSGATGKHYAIKLNGTVANPTGLTINNNVYFASGTGAVFGFYNSLDVADLATWRTNVGQDANSLSADPLYTSPTDLHLLAGSPAIDQAVDLGVTTDFDGKARPGANAFFDIGADERDGIPPVLNDIAATSFVDPGNGGVKLVGAAFSPRASFTNNGVGNQPSVTVRYRILNASMTEVYNQTATIAPFNSTATTTVTFPPATLGVLGAYTIIAKAELGTDTVPANDSITGSLTISNPLAGTYTVGSGGNFPSLTNGDGIFAALNNLGASGNITINLISDLTGETGANALNEIAGGYTVLLRPTGAARSITGSSAAGLVTINGADGVTIDGSVAGATAGDAIGGDDSIRQLTITNTSTGTSAVVIAILQGATSTLNNTIKNVKVVGQDPTTTLGAIVTGGASAGTVGIHTNLRIENCAARRSIYGIYHAGLSAAAPSTGAVITKNDLTGAAADRVRRVGIVVFNQNGAEISLNSIANLSTNESADGVGIGLGSQGVDNAVVTNGGVSNSIVTRNRIDGVSSLSTTGFSAVGISVAGDPAGPNVISNNAISNVTAPATSPDIVAGVFIAGVVGSDTRVFYNSISLTGDRGVVATQSCSFGVAITGANPIVQLRNNSFYTTQIASGGGVTAASYAIGTASTTFTNLASNNNLFFASGANAAFFRSGSLANSAGTNYATLALWQAATGGDAASLFGDPLYTSASDLTPLAATPLRAAGAPIAGVLVDLLGRTRSASAPSIGAYEVNPTSLTNLVLSAGVLAPAFNPGGFTYTASVANLTSSITVTPTASDAGATIQARVNGGTYSTVTSGSPSAPLPLNVGANPIDVQIMNGGFPTSTYTVTVTRAAAPPIPGVLAITTTQGNAITFSEASLLALASDPAGNTPITLVSVGQPTGGAPTGVVTNSAGVSITFTPNAAYLGTDTFSYTIQNSLGIQAVGTITVTVTSFTALPVATSRTPGGLFSTTYAGVPNVAYRIEYTDSLTVAFVPLLDGMGQPVVIMADGTGSFSFSEPGTPSKRFYRARALP